MSRVVFTRAEAAQQHRVWLASKNPMTRSMGGLQYCRKHREPLIQCGCYDIKEESDGPSS